MTVQVVQTYQFNDSSPMINTRIQQELNAVQQAINSANAGSLTWDNVKVVTLAATNASFTNPLPIASGGTNSGTALGNNKVITSSSGKIVESGIGLSSNSITLPSSKAIIFTDNSTNTVTLQASNGTTSWTFKLPTTAGTNTYLLQTDGSGNTSWVVPPSNPVASGTTNQIAVYTSSSTIGSASTITVATTFSASTGNPIHGTNTNDNASAGYIGEWVESGVGSTNFPTSGNYGDLTSISLTAGDWDVTAIMEAIQIAGTVSSVNIGISTTSGNSSTGLTGGDNLLGTLVGPTSSNNSGYTIPTYRVSIGSTTIVYLKFLAVYNSTAPVALGRLSARRIR